MGSIPSFKLGGLHPSSFQMCEKYCTLSVLFDGIMKSINQFAFDPAEQRLQEKMQDTGRGPENGGKNAENFEAKEKRDMTSFPKRE